MKPANGTALSEQQQFLALMKEGLPSGSHFLVAKPSAKGLPAQEWHEQHLTGRWYFSTGASSSKWQRTRENMVAVRAIILDDVGTKIPVDRITVEPTWKLETSKGNYQWGYLLKTWDADIEKADGLMQALVDNGLQDKGVNRSCRLFRIPGSVNEKPGNERFEADLVEIEAGRTFTLNSLAKAFKLKFAKIEKKDTGTSGPVDLADPIFKWLGERGMVRHEMSEGWWEIACPWPEEHSDERTEAKYRPAAVPGAMCFHGHGDDGGAYRKRFFEWVADQGGPKPGGTRPELVEMFAAIRTEPFEPPPKPGQPVALEPGATYNAISLAEGLGDLTLKALHRVRKTGEGKPAAKQDTSNANVLSCLNYLGVQPRLNLMNGITTYGLPDRIDPAGFADMLPHIADRMIHGALRDAINSLGLAKKEIDDNLTRIAESNPYHPVRAWIESVPWDGQDRLQHLLGSVDTPTPDLFATYFRRWALQTVEAACGWGAKRLRQEKPLCFVLAGPQGRRKSRWLESLAPEYFVGGKHLNLDASASAARDSIHEALQGWIVELGELDTTFSKSANGSLKAFLSKHTDEYRLPYAEAWGRRPRCTSFCASVNDAKFLKDDTGSRRYLVVWIEQCDEFHATDMQQFWAQMHTYWAAKEQYHLTPEEEKLQAANNEQHQAEDPIADTASTFAERHWERTEINCIECSVLAADVIQLSPGLRLDAATANKVAKGLRAVMGNPQELLKRGGHKQGWRLWLSSNDSKIAGKVLRPSKV
jgi:putative DNA primase/helicase